MQPFAHEQLCRGKWFFVLKQRTEQEVYQIRVNSKSREEGSYPGKKTKSAAPRKKTHPNQVALREWQEGFGGFTIQRKWDGFVALVKKNCWGGTE